jgi:hypothetical protein
MNVEIWGKRGGVKGLVTIPSPEQRLNFSASCPQIFNLCSGGRIEVNKVPVPWFALAYAGDPIRLRLSETWGIPWNKTDFVEHAGYGAIELSPETHFGSHGDA